MSGFDFKEEHDYIDKLLDKGESIEYNSDGSVKEIKKINREEYKLKERKHKNNKNISFDASFINNLMNEAHKI